MTLPLARRTSTHLLFAFIVMGGWAALANRAAPWPAPLMAGLVQGAMSVTLTFGFKRMIEALALGLDGRAARLAPPLASLALSSAILATVHALAGTPAVLATIAVPVAVSTLYAAGYAAALTRGARP